MSRAGRHRKFAKTLAALVAACVAGGALLCSAEPNRKQKSRGTAARTLAPLGPGERLESGVREPSGVAYHAKLRRLFVVGDEGTLAELDATGKVLRSAALGGNLEDVAVLPTGELLILSENSGELILFDPVARKEQRRWRLDAAALLGERPRDKSNGFEGLAFKEDSASRGGLLYLVHQRRPALVVTVTVDPANAPGVLGAGAVRERWGLGREDLTAATFVPSLGRLLVIAERDDRLLIVDRDGRVEAEAALPGVQQEGLCFDADGTLWVADDREGTLRRLPGALDALNSGLKGTAPGRP